MSLPSYAVMFRGHPACPCQATWLPAFEAAAQLRGILRGPLPLSQLIGGAAASAGTHSQGGADDTWPLTGIDVDAYVALSRQMGADATWHRPRNWDGKGGVEHVHRVLTGCPHNGTAHYQIDAVRDGYNGLGHLGRGGRDTGPRPLSGRTWREGIAWAQQEDDMATPDEIWAKELRSAGGRQAGVAVGQARAAAMQAAADAAATRALVEQMAKTSGQITDAQLAEIKQAIADAVIKVDVTVDDQTGA